MTAHRVLELFAGCGGAALGLTRAGWKHVACVERDGWPATLAAVDALRPTWFLAENVLGWTFHASSCRLGGGCVGCDWERRTLPALAARFPFSGTLRLDAADFGVPQQRRRLIVWGGPVPIPPPVPTHADPAHADARGLAPWRTLGEAVGDTLFAEDVCDHRASYPCDGSHGRACTEPWRRDRPAPTGRRRR